MGQKSHADTSWLIALLDPEDPHHVKALRDFEELASPPSISSLAFAELLVGFYSADFLTSIKELRAAFPSINPLDTERAILGAKLRSENKITLTDALIIASALIEKSELLTFDKSMKAVYERIK